MGSIGGNICNASLAADTPPPWSPFGARVNLLSAQGPREMALEDFITGYRETALQEGEFLESIVLPLPPTNSSSAFTYMARREAMEIAIVIVAVNLALEADSGKVSRIDIVMGAVGSPSAQGPPGRKVADGANSR